MIQVIHLMEGMTIQYMYSLFTKCYVYCKQHVVIELEQIVESKQDQMLDW